MGRKSQYTEDYKREAVAKAKTSGNVSQTARELGIRTKVCMNGSSNSVSRSTLKKPTRKN